MTAKVINRRGEQGAWSPDELDDAMRDRLRSNVKVTETGCWLWQGWCNPWGYGTTVYRKRNWMVHRLTLLWGPVLLLRGLRTLWSALKRTNGDS